MLSGRVRPAEVATCCRPLAAATLEARVDLELAATSAAATTTRDAGMRTALALPLPPTPPLGPTQRERARLVAGHNRA